MNDFKVKDIVYIILYHKIEGNIVYYITKRKIMYICNEYYYLSSNLRNKNYTTVGLRTYRKHRLYKTKEEAEKALLKKERQNLIKQEYKQKLKEIENDF